MNIIFMKMKIKTLVAVALGTAVIATGCTGAKENKTENENTEAQTAVANADLRGQWIIENIVFSDSDYVRPAEAVPGVSQYINFQDSTYSIITNCNSISGNYTVKGDSITLEAGPMTQMACENMATEDALRRILPDIATVEVQNDTIVRLNGTTPAECILLRKSPVEIK